MRSSYWILILVLFSSSLFSQESLVLSQPEDQVSVVSYKVLKEAYSRIGIDLNTVVLPAERSLVESNAGNTDGEVGRIRDLDNKYPNLIIVPVSVNRIEGVVITSGLDFNVLGWETLKPYKIGYRIGTKFVENGTQGMDRYPVTSNELLIRMLRSGSFDLIILARLEGMSLIKKYNIEGLIILEPPLKTFELFHYLHKKNASLLAGITNALEEMETEGRIEEIRLQIIQDVN